MAVRSRSAKAFLERAGVRRTLRPPLPTAAPGVAPVLRVGVSAPLPLAEYQAVTLGSPPPDRGVTAEWPHGSR